MASSFRLSPAPRNWLFSMRHSSQSVASRSSRTGVIPRSSSAVWKRSIVTSQPGLSSVSMVTPRTCSHSPLHCERYQACTNSSGVITEIVVSISRSARKAGLVGAQLFLESHQTDQSRPDEDEGRGLGSGIHNGCSVRRAELKIVQVHGCVRGHSAVKAERDG